jgi:peptidyl-prolyl cis-trans isomerase C
MTRTATALLTLASLGLVSSLALAQTPPAAPAAPAQQAAPAAPAPLPRVNGQPITEAEVAAAAAELGEALEQIPEAQRREQLVDYLVTVRILSAAAREARVDQTPEMQARLRFSADRTLMETWLRAEIEKALSREEIQKFYQERVASRPTEEEVRARHILVPTEEEARTLLAELRAGKTFEAVAAERSTDPGSKAEGGDLGFFTRGRMVPEFEQAVFALQPGQVTQTPVRSQFGFHIIRLEERRQQPVPTLQEVAPQIRQFLQRQAQTAIITRLRNAARVETGR